MGDCRDVLNYWLSCSSSQTWHCENASVQKTYRGWETDSKYIPSLHSFSPRLLTAFAGFCSGSSSLPGRIISPFSLMSVVDTILLTEGSIWCWASTPFLNPAVNLHLLLTSMGIFFSRFWHYEHWGFLMLNEFSLESGSDFISCSFSSWKYLVSRHLVQNV